MKRLFHYTTISRFLKIIQSGHIRQATAGVNDGERPAVWFSFRQDWEPTASPLLERDGELRRVAFEELPSIETPVRIEIAHTTAPLTWRDWRKASGVKSKVAKALEAEAIRQRANVADWRMSFQPVGGENWLAVEFFLNGEWQDAEKVKAESANLIPPKPPVLLGI